MKKKFSNVYQFKIQLVGIKPPIWRRIQVPETYNFWDLHVAIQDAMGWEDYHLHEFKIRNPKTGKIYYLTTPDEVIDTFDNNMLNEKKERISKWFTMSNREGEYTYDFGDMWVHKIKLEKILPRDESTQYPVCIGGKRACPPEDCGGVYGYRELLAAISDPNHPYHAYLLEWLGGEFDPEHFDPKSVKFDDPVKRWRILTQ